LIVCRARLRGSLPTLDVLHTNTGRARSRGTLSTLDVPSINTADPEVAQLFGLFQQVGLLTPEAVESFMSYGRTIQTPAQTIGWTEINVGDVQQARAL